MGKCLDSGCKVAIKVERVQQGREGTLQAEYDILCALSGDNRFPDVYHYGRQMLNCSPKATDVKVVVMQLLGSSVRELWWKRTRGSRGREPATVMNLGCRMLEVLEQLHLKGYIHRDLKPANFAMSGDEDGDKGRGQLCLIDFGIASPIANEQAKAEGGLQGLVALPARILRHKNVCEPRGAQGEAAVVWRRPRGHRIRAVVPAQRRAAVGRRGGGLLSRRGRWDEERGHRGGRGWCDDESSSACAPREVRRERRPARR